MHPTMKAAPKSNARTAAREASIVLAKYEEDAALENDENADALSTYQWLDSRGHTIKASHIDLGLEF
jgi:vacuolar-type H+-ATPase catalytic subunit A/Vma1